MAVETRLFAAPTTPPGPFSPLWVLPGGGGAKSPLYRVFISHTTAFGHVFVEETLVRAIGLDPFSVNYKLWDGTLAGAPHDLVGGSGRGFDVDVFVWQVVLVEE